MYNRYINADGFIPDPPQPEAEIPPQAQSGAFSQAAESRGKGLGGLKDLLGDRFKLPDLNGDTLLLLLMVYFLVSDPEDKLSDTILIIAALFLLGI